MHLLLTDSLCCPRCGPEFGLILISDEMVERRVVHGSLGCPNCRERYPVSGGFADLRPPPRPPLASGPVEPTDVPGSSVDSLTVAALLGIPGGPGNVLLVDPSLDWVTGLAEMVDGIEWVVGITGGVLGQGFPAGRGPVSIVALRGQLPFYSARMRGVVLQGWGGRIRLAEFARVLAPLGRMVILGPTPETREAFHAAGLAPVLNTPDALVGTRKS